MARKDASHKYTVADDRTMSVTSHRGRHVLNVHRKVGGKYVPCDANGKVFNSSKSAVEFAISHGYVIPFMPSHKARNDRLQRIDDLNLVYCKPPYGCAFAIPVRSLSAYVTDGLRFFHGTVEITKVRNKMIEFDIGTKVRYTSMFCAQTGSFMRHDGVVRDMLVMGPTQLAVPVEWPDGSVKLVNTDNLVVQEARYRGFKIEQSCVFPPTPLSGCDWTWVHEDYDGPEDNRAGAAASVVECKAQIDAFLDN